MSQYLYIYIRTDNSFWTIFSGSRVHPVYKHLFSFAPYEHIKKLEPSVISKAIDEIQNVIHAFDEDIKAVEEKINFIRSTESDLNKRLDLFDVLRTEKNGLLCEQNELTVAMNQLSLLYDIVRCSCKFNCAYYFGLETGYSVTTDDIKEE